MTMMILMMIITIAIIIAIMITMIKMILIAAVIIINIPSEPGDFSPRSTTVLIACLWIIWKSIRKFIKSWKA